MRTPALSPLLSAPPNTHTSRSADPVRTLWALTGLCLGLLLCFLAAAVLDERRLYGGNVWLKPIKFSLSFVLMYATLACVVERLSVSVRERLALRATVAALVVATCGEITYISARAGMGLSSHFATSTVFEATMYGLMGVGSLVLVAGVAVVGWLAGRDGSARLGPGLRMGVRWGFLLSALLTLVVAGYLSSSGGHFVGVPSVHAASIPLLGWSLEVGDLRPAHFLALHAMQALPLFGWWLDRRRVRAAAWVRGAALAYAGLTVAVFVQALLGLPLWS